MRWEGHEKVREGESEMEIEILMHEILKRNKET